MLADGPGSHVGGAGIVSHEGLALLRALADKTGLRAGLSKAVASGRLLADLACAIADGAEVIGDFRVRSDQGELFGLVALVPTCWRALSGIAACSLGCPPPDYRRQRHATRSNRTHSSRAGDERGQSGRRVVHW